MFPDLPETPLRERDLRLGAHDAAALAWSDEPGSDEDDGDEPAATDRDLERPLRARARRQRKVAEKLTAPDLHVTLTCGCGGAECFADPLHVTAPSRVAAFTIAREEGWSRAGSGEPWYSPSCTRRLRMACIVPTDTRAPSVCDTKGV